MANEYYVGDVGTQILLDTGIDITGATNTKIKCRKPDGTIVSWTASISATTKLAYTIIAGDFNLAGTYHVQTSLTLGAWSGLGEDVTFEVYEAYNTSYTTPAKVSSLLRLINTSTLARKVFDSTTDPTISEVEDFIRQSEADIDEETGHSWRPVTVSNEYHDGTDMIYLAHRDIKAFTSGTDKIELWDGSAWINLVGVGYTEGRANDFWVDYSKGVIFFENTSPWYSEKGVRVSYRYGAASVPLDIEEACTKLAAIKLLDSEDYKRVLPEGGSSDYALSSKVDSWRKDIRRILGNHQEIISV